MDDNPVVVQDTTKKPQEQRRKKVEAAVPLNQSKKAGRKMNKIGTLTKVGVRPRGVSGDETRKGLPGDASPTALIKVRPKPKAASSGKRSVPFDPATALGDEWRLHGA